MLIGYSNFMPAPKKPLASISIPCRGDEITRAGLNKLAESKGVFVADLVANAIKTVYGGELRSMFPLFFAENGSRKNQDDTASTTQDAR
jgi:hypothetical protein